MALRLSFLAALVAAIVPATAAADGFRSFSISGLYGSGFDDAIVGNSVTEGGMTTLTVETFAEWKYGDAFLFVDLSHGKFGKVGGRVDDAHFYGEVIPRLSLSKIAGTKLAFGPIADVVIVGEFDRGSGFAANMGGVGLDFAVPGFVLFQLNGMVRKDNFNDTTWQSTFVWKAPFEVAGVGFSFEGFADVYGTNDLEGKAGGFVNVMTQPQLVLDAGRLAGADPGIFWLGTEWYLHRSLDLDPEKLEMTWHSFPQALVKATW